MTLEQWVFAGASAALTLAFARGVSVPDRRTLVHPAIIGAAVLFAISLLARAMFVEPTLIHADLAAPFLVDCVLQFPQPCANPNRGASYGQYGFWLVGGMSQLLGGDLGAVFRAMQIIAALNIALVATLAYRLSGSPYGALLAVAATGTNPIFMRVAASEDMHNVGLFLGLLAFVAMDAFAVTRRTLALVAAVLALGLMIHTRQTFHVLAPCVFLLGLARGGRDLLKAPVFWAAGTVALGVLIARVFGSDSGSLTQQMFAIIGQPVLLPNILRHHALFDIPRFGPLSVLTIAAIIWACLAGGTPRAVVIVFGLNFLVTYPCGMPSPGVELAQRLSTHMFGMLLFAMGGAAFLESRIARGQRLLVASIASLALIAIPPVFPGWRTLSEITPIHREYVAVTAAASELPQEFTEIILPISNFTSWGGARYAGLLSRMGKTVHPVLLADAGPMPRPWLFLENIECWTYSFNELSGEGQGGASPGQSQVRWDRVIFGRQPSPVRPPAAARPECEPFLQRGRPIGSRRVITDPPDDPPFLFYASDAVPIQFYELPAPME